MTDFTEHQKRIIDRYYSQRESIMLTKLQELVTELFLAETDKKRERLWERVHSAMINIEVKPAIIEHIMTRRSPEVLAKNVEVWLKQAQSSKPGR